MASSTLVETVNINLDEFSESFLTCSTCFLLFDQEQRRAKLLPCSHSICLSCLQQIAALPQNDGISLRCPMCRDDCILPAGGVVNLPAAFLINKLLDVMQRQRKDVVPSCSTHPQEQLLYCESCDLVFCAHCQTSQINKKCTEHTVIPFSIALKRMSEIVVYRAKGRLRALETAQSAVKEEIELLDKNVDRIVDQINSTFQEVSNLVENRRRELIESVRVRRDEKRKVLKDQIETITDEKKKLEKEVASCQLDIRSMAKNLKALDGSLDSKLSQPRENAFLRLNTNASKLVSEVQHSLSEFGELTASTTFPGASTIECPEGACTHTESKLLVRTFNLHGRPRSRGGDPISAKIHNKDGVESGILVNDLDDGTYELLFRVSESGEYVVEVDIFGRPLKNSPFHVTVSSHHTPKWQLPVELREPTKMAIEGTNVFYVLDTGNDRIRVVKDSGDVIRDLRAPCLEGNSAVGMLLLNNQEIVVLNWRKKAITRMTIQGEEIQSVTFSEFAQPIDLAIDSRGRFLIADQEKVFVFDTALRPLFSFPVKSVVAINAGLDDDILVSTSHGLMLYDGAGRFLRDIELAPTTHKGRLMAKTAAVCPQSGLVISAVVDRKSNRTYLAVSRYKGSFGFWLDSKGSRLRSPCGMWIGSGQRTGQCFVVDHATASIKMYKYK